MDEYATVTPRACIAAVVLTRGRGANCTYDVCPAGTGSWVYTAEGVTVALSPNPPATVTVGPVGRVLPKVGFGGHWCCWAACPMPIGVALVDGVVPVDVVLKAPGKAPGKLPTPMPPNGTVVGADKPGTGNVPKPPTPPSPPTLPMDPLRVGVGATTMVGVARLDPEYTTELTPRPVDPEATAASAAPNAPPAGEVGPSVVVGRTGVDEEPAITTWHPPCIATHRGKSKAAGQCHYYCGRLSQLQHCCINLTGIYASSM